MAHKDLTSRLRPLSPDELKHMEAEADRALQELAADYLSITGAQLEELQRSFANPNWSDVAWSTQVYRTAHEIKGQGSTFGFNLISEIGASLCRLIRQREKLAPADFDRRAAAHCAAIRAVLEKGIKGDGGSEGAALLELLGPPLE
jgi:HPt (histidine-containing phosphotransfer) domain-containing protein